MNSKRPIALALCFSTFLQLSAISPLYAQETLVEEPDILLEETLETESSETVLDLLTEEESVSDTASSETTSSESASSETTSSETASSDTTSSETTSSAAVDGTSITTFEQLQEFLTEEGVTYTTTTNNGNRIILGSATTFTRDFVVPADVFLVSQWTMTFNCKVTVNGAIQDNRSKDYNTNDIVNGNGSVVITDTGRYIRLLNGAYPTIIGTGGNFTLGTGATMTLTSGNYDITTGTVTFGKDVTSTEVSAISIQKGATLTKGSFTVASEITITDENGNSDGTGGTEDDNNTSTDDGSSFTTHAEYMAFLQSKGLTCSTNAAVNRVFIDNAAVIDFDLVVPEGILLIPIGKLTVNKTITVKGTIQDNRMTFATSDLVNGTGKIVIESTGAYAKYTGVGSAYTIVGSGGFMTLGNGATVTLTSVNDKPNYEVSSGTVTLAKAVTTTDIPAITFTDGATFTYDKANVGAGVTINGVAVGGTDGDGDANLSNQQKLYNALKEACGTDEGLSTYADNTTVAISKPVTLSKDVEVLSNSKIQIATGGSLTIAENVTLNVNHIVQDSRPMEDRPDGVISGKGSMVFHTGSQYYINEFCLVGSTGRLQQGANSEITITSIKDRNTVSDTLNTGNELEITKGNVNLSAAIDASLIQRISVGIEGTFSPNVALIDSSIEYIAPKLERVALLEVLNVANANAEATTVSVDGSNVGSDVYWVTQSAQDIYKAAIAVAQKVWNNDSLDNSKYGEAKEILTTAHNTFNASKALGNLQTDIIDTAEEIVAYLNSITPGCAAINGTENPDGISLSVVEVKQDVEIDRNFTIPSNVRLRTTAQMTVNADITVDGQIQDYRDAGFISGSGLVGTNGTGRVIFHEGSGGLYIKGQGKMVGAKGTGASSADGVLVATGAGASFALTNRNNLVVLSGNVNLTAQIPAVFTTSIVVNGGASFIAKGALADSIAMSCYGTYVDQSILNTSVILNGVATTVKSNSSNNVSATIEDGYLKFEVKSFVTENDVEVVFANATGEEAVVTFSVINGAIREKKILKFGSLSADELNTAITTKIKELESLVKQAEAKGLGAEYEKSTLWFAKEFQSYADWDDTATGQAQNLKMFQSVSYSPYGKTAEDLAKELPEFERTEVIEMLDRSIEEIEQVISGDIVRRDVNMFDWSKVTHEGSNFYDKDGRAVFLHDYFSKPLTEETNNPVLYNHYMGMVDKPTSINANLVTSSNGGFDTAKINSITTRPDGAGAGYMMLWHTTLPTWFAPAKGNSIWDGYSNFTKYDIDSEALRDLWSTLLEEIIPSTEQAPYTVMGYCAANEPHWFLDQSHWGMIKLEDGTAGFSELSHDKLEAWLKEKYNTIDALNTAYGNDAKGNAYNFTSFEEASDQLVPLVPATHKGTPAWYDVCVFNMERSLEWLTFLNDEIVENNEYAKTHYKIMPDLFAEEDRSHGINFEDVTNMAGMIGDDAKIRTENNLKNTGHDETEWNEDYAYMWREVVITYDFLSSIAPDKAHVNSEVHFLSTTAWRDLYMDPEYVRSTYWLGTVLGMDAGFTWFWGREANGEIETRLQTTDNTGLLESYPASVAQQPQVANALSTTMMELNAFSEEVVALQEQERPLRVFYSETSAIVKTHHMTELYQLNESLVFEGYPIGYVTENILNNPEEKDFYNPENFDVVIVYKTEYVTDAEFKALQGYLNNGGTVILDGVSLKKDEHGNARTETLTAGKGNIITAESTTAGITAQALKVTRDLSPITVTEKNGNSSGQKGVVWRVIEAQDGSDNYVVSLMNLGKYDAEVTLGGVYKVTDMFTQETLSQKVSIPSEGVMMLEVSTSDTSGSGGSGGSGGSTGGSGGSSGSTGGSSGSTGGSGGSTGGSSGSTGGSSGSTGGSSGSTGGSNSSSSDSSSSDSTGKVEVSTELEVSATEDSLVKAELTSDILSDMLEQVQKEKDNLDKVSSTQVTVNLELTLVEGETLQLHFAEEIFANLVAEAVDTFSVTLPEVVLSFNTEALTTISKEVDGEISLNVTKKEIETLSNPVKTLLGDRPVFTFTLEDSKGGKVSDFGSGFVEVVIPYTVNPRENTGNLKVLYVNLEGKTMFMEDSRYSSSQGGMVFTTNHFSTYAVVETVNNIDFTDISTHWGKDYVQFVVASGLFGGTTPSTFSPDVAMTRGMVVTVLGQLAGIDPTNYGSSSFSDVKDSDYYSAYVAWAEEEGIVAGTGKGRYSPQLNVSREELAVMMVGVANYLEIPLESSTTLDFKDAEDISSWASSAVSAMENAGLISGAYGHFYPESPSNRAEVAVILRNILDIL